MRASALLFALASLAAAAESLPPEPVDINTASVDELAAIRGLSRRQAETVVRVRERNGPFRSIQELRAIPRVSEKAFERLRNLVKVTLETDGNNSPEHRAADRLRQHPP